MFVRILLVIAGLSLGYAGIYGGSTLNPTWAATWSSLSTFDLMSPSLNPMFLCSMVLLFGIGLIMWIFAIGLLQSSDLAESRSSLSASCAACAFWCACILFSIIAGPLIAYGPWPTEGILFLLCGALPLFAVIHGVVDDILYDKRSKKRNNVIPLRK